MDTGTKILTLALLVAAAALVVSASLIWAAATRLESAVVEARIATTDPTLAVESSSTAKPTPRITPTRAPARTSMRSVPRPTSAPLLTLPIDSTRAPTPTTPIDSSANICGRSPVMQQTLVQTLRMSSCRLITNAELFRVTKLERHVSQPQSGDFVGLVNLEDYILDETDEWTLKPGILTGLTGLKALRVYTTASLVDGVVVNLPELEKLTIETRAKGGDARRPASFRLPAFDLPNLKLLDVYTTRATVSPHWTISPGQLDGLPSLEYLKVKHNGDCEKLIRFHLPDGLFGKTPNLKGIRIDLGHGGCSGGDYIITADQTLLADLPELENLHISPRQNIDAPRQLSFRLHPDSPLLEQLLEDGIGSANGYKVIFP